MLSKDLLSFLVSMEPRVSELVESEIMNNGQKVSIVIKIIVERISYSLKHVYDEKVVPTVTVTMRRFG